MKDICLLFGKSRQAWYETVKRKDAISMQDFMVLEQVKILRIQMPRIGLKKLHFMLDSFYEQHQIKLGRDKLADLLRGNDLLVKKMKRSIARTTFSAHGFLTYANLLKIKQIHKANQAWVSDITYIRLPRGFAYLSLITDVYSKKIVGWNLNDTLEAKGAMNALMMAIDDLPQLPTENTPLIHHSDRGIQYCCHEYINALIKARIKISMAAVGDPYENVLAERMNRTLKEEFYIGKMFIDFQDALQTIQHAIKIYNNKRPHGSCDYLTPNQAFFKEGELKKRWYQRKEKNSEKSNTVIA